MNFSNNFFVAKAGAVLVILGMSGVTPAFGVTIGPLDGASDFVFDNSDPDAQAGPGSVATAPNTSTGVEGFNNFFSSDYGLLGSQDGASIGAGTSSDLSIAFRNFSVAARDLNRPIQVTFDYAFNGDPQDDLSSVDFFTVDVIRPGAIGQGVFSGNATNFSAAVGQVETLPGGFVNTPGEYQLRFALAEVGSGGNSALGFDNVQVESVPEPSSMLGTLALGTLGAGYMLSRRIKKRKTVLR